MRSTKRLNEVPSAPNSSLPWITRRLVRSPSPSAMSCIARPMVSNGCISTRMSMPSRAMMITTAITMAISAEVRNSLSIANAVSLSSTSATYQSAEGTPLMWVKEISWVLPSSSTSFRPGLTFGAPFG
ncbi:hypothetical protein D3C81_1411040 [compost metagenome]